MALFKSDGNIDCNIIPSGKFTGNLISVYFILPLDGDITKNSLLAKVLKNSNAEYGSVTEINSFLELNYGASLTVGISKIGESQVVRFSAAFLKDKYALDGEKISENMGGLLKSVIANPLFEGESFKADAVETEKQNLKDLILSRKNNKRSYAVFRCREEMCKNEAYGKDELGNVEELEKITAAELYFHYPVFINKARVYIQFTGDFTEEYARNFANSLFPKPKTSNPPLPVSIVKTSRTVREVTEKMDVSQSLLVMGYRTGIDFMGQYKYEYAVMNSVLGGGVSSLLFKNVREKMSLCYFCASMTDRLKGVMLVYSGISAENRDRAEDAVKEQIETLRQGKISDGDIEAAKADLINQYNQVGDSPAALDSYYFSGFFSGDMSSPEERTENILKVTGKDISSAANRLSLDTVYFLTGNGGGKDE